MTELAGRLSERVRFEGKDEVRGLAGNRTGDWRLRFVRWAAVEQVPRAERAASAGETRHSARRWKVMIRNGVRPTLDMRLVWRGESLILTGVEEDPAGSGWLIIWAEDASI